MTKPSHLTYPELKIKRWLFRERQSYTSKYREKCVDTIKIFLKLPVGFTRSSTRLVTNCFIDWPGCIKLMWAVILFNLYRIPHGILWLPLQYYIPYAVGGTTYYLHLVIRFITFLFAWTIEQYSKMIIDGAVRVWNLYPPKRLYRFS